ncbi:MAG: alkaline phosphatase family protein [Candidatus Nanoarchaeia archaeon]|nr:alkaline phosphatase family protein [Candidatus Jingweiarchaeum tengchongense]
MRKIIFVIIDGGSDTPCKELNGLTPFDVANKPNIDFLARNGRNGIIYPFARDFAPESDVATIALLGYDPIKYHVGRGPVEALGAGIKITNGELALRCNLATLEKNQIVDVRGGGISDSDASMLVEEINEKVKIDEAEFLLKHTIGYRAVLIISKKDTVLSNEITNTHPGYNAEQVDLIWEERGESMKFIFNEAQRVKTTRLLSCKPLSNKKEAKISASLVNEFISKSKDVLESSEINKRREMNGMKKVNVILTRDAGNRLPVLDSYKKRFNLEACCIADMPLERGIAAAAGMHVIDLKERDVLVGLEEKFKKIMQYYDSFNFFYVHIKGCDEASHRRNAIEKKNVIEMIDKYFFGNLLRYINTRETIICITCDHTTSSELGVHTADPVPFTISGANIIRDNTQKFSEKNCVKGSLGSIIGKNLVPMLLGFLRR